MEINLHGAWEIIVGQINCTEKESLDTEPFVNNTMVVGEKFNYVTFVSKGINVNFQNIKTGQIIPVPENTFWPFDFDFEPGEYKLSFDELKYICISPFTRNNYQYLPLNEKVVPFRLKSGDSCFIQKDSRLLLVKGSLRINEQTYKEVNRIKFSSGGKDVFALEDCYGFFIT
jgi:hypothetical protein